MGRANTPLRSRGTDLRTAVSRASRKICDWRARPRFDSPHAPAQIGDPLVRISCGDEHLTLDLRRGARVLE